jgi:hypothetical protein
MTRCPYCFELIAMEEGIHPPCREKHEELAKDLDEFFTWLDSVDRFTPEFLREFVKKQSRFRSKWKMVLSQSVSQ